MSETHSKTIYFKQPAKKKPAVAREVLYEMGIYKDGFGSWEKVKKYFNLYTPLDKTNYELLETLQPNKNMVRYYDLDTKQFKFGGLLVRYSSEIRPNILIKMGKIFTTLYLDSIILFIPPKLVKRTTEGLERKKMERYIKNKLYKMFLKGELTGVDSLYDMFNLT